MFLFVRFLFIIGGKKIMANEILDLENQAVEISGQADKIIIKNQAGYDEANTFLRNIKALQAEVKNSFRPIIEQAFATHRAAVKQEKEHLEPLVKAYDLVNGKMLAYYQEQERIRREQERKLQEEAEKKRQEAIAKAETLRAEGKEARAEKYEEKAASIISPQLAPTIDKGGAVIKKLYRAEVYDLMALVKGIVDGKAPLLSIEPNMVLLNSQARALKDAMSYPGVKVICEDNLSIRK